MDTFPKSSVGSQYFTPTDIKPNTKNAPPPTFLSGWMIRVRFDRLTIGNNITLFSMFFDPAPWWWPKVTSGGALY
jgi:hypothetical protein